METEKSIFEKVSAWIQNSIMLKLLTITILMLLLLIPTAMINDIIKERASLSKSATEEVQTMWARPQVVKGPVLTVPLLSETKDEDGKTQPSVEVLNILPDTLTIKGEITPKVLKRGIYEVIVYTSTLHISGNFNPYRALMNQKDKIIRYDQAFLTVGIEDLRGVVDQVVCNLDDESIQAEPGSKIPELIASGITFKVPEMEKDHEAPLRFDFVLNLQGSQNLSFVPLGKITRTELSSDWPSPSFNGSFIPDDREVSDTGFTAKWKILELNRNFPQAWIGDHYSKNITEATYGVDLVLPVDNYQKLLRTTKYAVMCIALTFLVFFLVEVLNKKRIHPFQYALVGLAISLFYILLVSISEQTNFNMAYLIASVAIIVMITLYSQSVFRSGRFTTILGIILVLLYGFLFVILQLTDYALIIGSIGLTLILGATMYLTRNLDWYSVNQTGE